MQPSPRCSTSLFLMGGMPTESTTAKGAANDAKPSSTTTVTRTLSQGKSLSRRMLPIQNVERTPPKFPSLSLASNVGATNDGNKPSEQPQQQHIFNLLPPTSSSSSSDEMDIAREAMRLTRETLHGAMAASSAVPSSVTTRNPQDSSSSDGDSSSSAQRTDSTTSVMSMDHCTTGAMRLNKFVRRLYNMLKECDSGLVEWRRGLLVLKDTHAFAKDILPKYFNTRNFKTFRRQLNYYGFVHIRSFSNNGDSTTALWVNGELAGSPCPAGTDPDHVSSVLLLRRVEPCDQVKTAEMRRARKELAISTIEKDFGVSAKTLQLQQLGNLCNSSAQKVTTPSQKQTSQSARAKQQQRRSPAPSIPKSRATPVVVVEHPTLPQPTSKVVEQQATSTTSPLLPFPVESVNYNAAEQQKPAAPLSSNTSAANLLLLLSRA